MKNHGLKPLFCALVAVLLAWSGQTWADITVNVKADAAPFLYAWNDDGGLNGEWPGTQMTDTRTTPDRQVWFTQTFKDVSELNIIFNNGSGSQTSDITGLTEEEYFFTYNGISTWADVSETYRNMQTYRLYLRSDQTADFNVYAWTEDADVTLLNGEWPGDALEQVDIDGVKYYLLETYKPVLNLICSTSEGQTRDYTAIDITEEPKLVYCPDLQEILPVGNYSATENTLEVQLLDDKSTFNLYAWDDDNWPLHGPWPGEALQKGDGDAANFTWKTHAQRVNYMFNTAGDADKTNELSHDFGAQTSCKVFYHAAEATAVPLQADGYVMLSGVEDESGDYALTTVTPLEKAETASYLFTATIDNSEADRTVHFLIMPPTAMNDDGSDVADDGWRQALRPADTVGNYWITADEGQQGTLTFGKDFTQEWQTAAGKKGTYMLSFNVNDLTWNVVFTEAEEPDPEPEKPAAYDATNMPDNLTRYLGETRAWFVNTGQWEHVYAYAWSGEGEAATELSGTFPGTELENVGQDKAGNGIYLWMGEKNNLPANIIFSNSNVDEKGHLQTEDLAFVNGGFYDFYKLQGTVEAVYNTANAPDFGYTETHAAVMFVNTEGWNQVFVYAWTGEGEDNVQQAGPWPGTAMTAVGEDADGYPTLMWDGGRIDATPQHVIFSDGTTQTADLDYVNGGIYYQKGLVGNGMPLTDPMPSEYDKANIPDGLTAKANQKTAFFANTIGWEKVYAYSFKTLEDGTTDESLGTWPGTEITTIAQDKAGINVYQMTLAGSTPMPDAVIFNNGNADGTELTQTANLTFANGGYYDYYALQGQMPLVYNADDVTGLSYVERDATVYFVNTLNWPSVYLCLPDFAGSADAATFPGVLLEDVGEDAEGCPIYKWEMSKVKEAPTTVIFSNGTDKTEAFDYQNGGVYYADGFIKQANLDERTYYKLYVRSHNDEPFNLYAWTEDHEEPNGAYPGDVLTDTEEVGDAIYYVLETEASVVNVLFSQGYDEAGAELNKTIDITNLNIKDSVYRLVYCPDTREVLRPEHVNDHLTTIRVKKNDHTGDAINLYAWTDWTTPSYPGLQLTEDAETGWSSHTTWASHLDFLYNLGGDATNSQDMSEDLTSDELRHLFSPATKTAVKLVNSYYLMSDQGSTDGMLSHVEPLTRDEQGRLSVSIENDDAAAIHFIIAPDYALNEERTAVADDAAWAYFFRPEADSQSYLVTDAAREGQLVFGRDMLNNWLLPADVMAVYDFSFDPEQLSWTAEVTEIVIPEVKHKLYVCNNEPEIAPNIYAWTQDETGATVQLTADYPGDALTETEELDGQQYYVFETTCTNINFLMNHQQEEEEETAATYIKTGDVVNVDISGDSLRFVYFPTLAQVLEERFVAPQSGRIHILPTDGETFYLYSTLPGLTQNNYPETPGTQLVPGENGWAVMETFASEFGFTLAKPNIQTTATMENMQLNGGDAYFYYHPQTGQLLPVAEAYYLVSTDNDLNMNVVTPMTQTEGTFTATIDNSEDPKPVYFLIAPDYALNEGKTEVADWETILRPVTENGNYIVMTDSMAGRPTFGGSQSWEIGGDVTATYTVSFSPMAFTWTTEAEVVEPIVPTYQLRIKSHEPSDGTTIYAWVQNEDGSTRELNGPYPGDKIDIDADGCYTIETTDTIVNFLICEEYQDDEIGVISQTADVTDVKLNVEDSVPTFVYYPSLLQIVPEANAGDELRTIRVRPFNGEDVLVWAWNGLTVAPWPGQMLMTGDDGWAEFKTYAKQFSGLMSHGTYDWDKEENIRKQTEDMDFDMANDYAFYYNDANLVRLTDQFFLLTDNGTEQMDAQLPMTRQEDGTYTATVDNSEGLNVHFVIAPEMAIGDEGMQWEKMLRPITLDGNYIINQEEMTTTELTYGEGMMQNWQVPDSVKGVFTIAFNPLTLQWSSNGTIEHPFIPTYKLYVKSNEEDVPFHLYAWKNNEDGTTEELNGPWPGNELAASEDKPGYKELVVGDSIVNIILCHATAEEETTTTYAQTRDIKDVDLTDGEQCFIYYPSLVQAVRAENAADEPHTITVKVLWADHVNLYAENEAITADMPGTVLTADDNGQCSFTTYARTIEGQMNQGYDEQGNIEGETPAFAIDMSTDHRYVCDWGHLLELGDAYYLASTVLSTDGSFTSIQPMQANGEDFTATVDNTMAVGNSYFVILPPEALNDDKTAIADWYLAIRPTTDGADCLLPDEAMGGDLCLSGNNVWAVEEANRGTYTVTFMPESFTWVVTFDRAIATSILDIEHSALNIDHSCIYDLQGRRINGQSSTFNGQSSMFNGQLKKGVYIINGRKVVR